MHSRTAQGARAAKGGTSAEKSSRAAQLPLPKRSSARNAPPILLDLDGTLIDSVYEHVMAWRAALETKKIKLPNWKIHRRIGMSGSLFLPTLLRELGQHATAAEIAELEKIRGEIFTKKIPELQVLPGANALLEYLGRIGAKWAIATTGQRDQTERLLKKLEMPREATVVTGDDVKTAKPAPDCFVAGARRLRVEGSAVVVVGDSPWDLLAAQRMKALGVGLLCGGYAQTELERAGAYRVYEDPADLLAHVEELGIPTQ